MSEVVGRVSGPAAITAAVSAHAQIVGTVGGTQQIGGAISVGSIESARYPHFAGPYEVAPELSETQVQCAYSIMDENIVVGAIPVYETVNPEGGITISIGG